jgi:hypothetical protein
MQRYSFSTINFRQLFGIDYFYLDFILCNFLFMKKITSIFPISIWLLGICMSYSCQHEVTMESGVLNSDPRNAYVGKYSIHRTENCYGPCDTCHNEQDLIVIVHYGSTDSTILFENREITISHLESYYDYHYHLIIKNDSLHSWLMNGGLGCGVNIYQSGVRIDKNPE